MSRTEGYAIYRDRFDGYRQILSLLNKLNAIQLRKGKEITTTAQHISRVFGELNRARAALKRAKTGNGWAYGF